MAKDGIFTGILTNTSQKGAYRFKVKVDIENWKLGEDTHNRNEKLRSKRFVREVLVSASVGDPNDVETNPEDDPNDPKHEDTDDPDNITTIIWILYVILVLLILVIILILRCCCRKGTTRNTIAPQRD